MSLPGFLSWLEERRRMPSQAILASIERAYEERDAAAAARRRAESNAARSAAELSRARAAEWEEELGRRRHQAARARREELEAPSLQSVTRVIHGTPLLTAQRICHT